MSKVFSYFILLFLIIQSAAGQTGASSNNMLKDEQQKFIHYLKGISVDSVTILPLAGYFDSATTRIYQSVMSDPALTRLEKEKAVRSLGYFMTQLSNNSVQHKLDVYDMRHALKSYKDILDAVVHHKPFVHLLIPVRPSLSQTLTSAFSQYDEHRQMDEISVYKRIAASPDFILSFLENKPDFKFADSLVVQAAAHDPLKLVYYYNSGRKTIQDRIRKNKNPYVRQIIALSGDRNATELYPFVIQIADGKLNPQEILVTRADVTQYFQLMINTLKQSVLSDDSSSVFLKILRNGIRQKANSFYVNQVNELHNSPAAVRFASVKKLRPEDLYYIMTSCGDELYTSSYIGLYKQLMGGFGDNTADSLFDIVHHDNFSLFLRLAANYNVAVDFLHRLSVQEMEQSLRRFMSNIDENPETGLNKAMDIADFFSGLDASADINGLVSAELRGNLNRCIAERNYFGIKLYSTLQKVFAWGKERNGVNKLWALLGNYELLKRTALESKDKEIVELVLFYGDEDGKASFNSFLKLYTDTSAWKITRNANWVSLRSAAGHPVVMYANLPLDSEEEMDLRAQDSLVDFLQQQSLQPSVLIHRGHSYHLDKTLKRLTPSVKLAVLGSCGSYNHAIGMASISPDVQVIGSKKTGAMSINDPLIHVINETLLEERDLVWTEIWGKLSARFSRDELTTSLFGEYFSPDNNLSLFVLKLFNL